MQTLTRKCHTVAVICLERYYRSLNKPLHELKHAADCSRSKPLASTLTLNSLEQCKSDPCPLRVLDSGRPLTRYGCAWEQEGLRVAQARTLRHLFSANNLTPLAVRTGCAFERGMDGSTMKIAQIAVIDRLIARDSESGIYASRQFVEEQTGD